MSESNDIREIRQLSIKTAEAVARIESQLKVHSSIPDRVASLERWKSWVLGISAGIGSLAAYASNYMKGGA